MLTNTQMSEILRGYEEKQNNARLALQERKKKIYAAVPEVQAMDEEIASYSKRSIALMLDSIGTKDAEKAKEHVRNLRKKKKKILEKAGYTLDDLEMKFECPDCEDTGYIRVGNRQERCHCLKKAAINLLYKQSNLQNVLKRENFDTFSLQYYSAEPDPETGKSPRDNAIHALAVAHDFVDHFTEDHSNLLLFGTPGTGKTFLTHCIHRALLDNICSVLYLTAFEMFNALENIKFHHTDDGERQNEDFINCDLLIIDDLGTELSNSFTNSVLFNILNERLQRDKSTIISSNLDFGGLRSNYSERIFSRIIGNYTCLRLTGTDIRMQKKLLQ